MKTQKTKSCIAFDGHRLIAKGSLKHVAEEVKLLVDRVPEAIVTVFDAVTSHIVELDLRGTVDDVRTRLSELEQAEGERGEQETQRGPGRPKLGVVSKEVGLLPRHWEWLRVQPGGASAALRRVVEEARKANTVKDGVRAAQGAAYSFMSAMAGDLPGYEEALRALYAGDAGRFTECIADWPQDVREHARELAHGAFSS